MESAAAPSATLRFMAKKPDTSRDYKVQLWEADGSKAVWDVVFRPIPRCNGKTVYGRYDMETCTITINCRLRDPEIIFGTVMHEATHVALGAVASEYAVESVEENCCAIVKKMWKGRR